MNEDVLKMINTLHARLKDVEVAVGSLETEQPQFVQKLDKVDDQVYAIQCEIEKLAAAGTSAESAEAANADGAEAQAAQAGDQAASSSAGEEDKPLLSDDMKDNLKDAGRALGGILKDSREVVSELSGTVKDIKGAFKLK